MGYHHLLFLHNDLFLVLAEKKSKVIGGSMPKTKKQFSLLEELPMNTGANFSMFKTSFGKIRCYIHLIGVERKIQRKYEFIDIPGGHGHPWQRSIFESVLVGNSIGTFEFSRSPKDPSLFNIEDGQQRHFTMLSIFENKIRLPKVISHPEYKDLGGKHFCQLPVMIQNEILNRDILVCVTNAMEKWKRYNRFVKLQEGIDLSPQDIRSGQPTEAASYIQSLVDAENDVQYGVYCGTTYPKFNMFQTETQNDKIIHSYVEINPRGRSMEEVVANWFSYIRYGGKESIGNNQLNTMYDEFKSGHGISIEDKDRFEKILKKVDSLITKHNHSKGLTKKPLHFLVPVLIRFLNDGVKIDDYTFVRSYLNAISKLKDENKTWIPTNQSITKKSKKGKTKKPTAQKFDYVFRQLSHNDAVTYIVNEIYDKMIETMKLNGTYLEIDSKRNFSADQKLMKLAEQNDKCAYCGTDIDLHDSHGDHILPHSKGGKTEIDNLAMACPECNQKKSDMTPEEWESVSNDNLSLAA